MLNFYVAQHTTVWKNDGTVDAFGKLQREVVEFVPCRFEHQKRVATTREGVEIVSHSQLFTTHPVQVDDLVLDSRGNKRPVRHVETAVTLGGKAGHYEVLL